MMSRQRAIAHSSWLAGFISDREYMGRYIAEVFGVRVGLVLGIRQHRSGHRHRGTPKWENRYHLRPR
jgi:hypothetical protein